MIFTGFDDRSCERGIIGEGYDTLISSPTTDNGAKAIPRCTGLNSPVAAFKCNINKARVRASLAERLNIFAVES